MGLEVVFCSTLLEKLLIQSPLIRACMFEKEEERGRGREGGGRWVWVERERERGRYVWGERERRREKKRILIHNHITIICVYIIACYTPFFTFSFYLFGFDHLRDKFTVLRQALLLFFGEGLAPLPKEQKSAINHTSNVNGAPCMAKANVASSQTIFPYRPKYLARNRRK